MCNRTTAISNVTLQNVELDGDPTFTNGGKMFSWNCNNCSVVNSIVNFYSNGVAYTVVGTGQKWFNVNCLNPNLLTPLGVGGFRLIGGSDISVFGGHCDSGDDTWQISPTPVSAGSPNSNTSAVGIHYVGVGGSSSMAHLFVAGLTDQAASPGAPTMTACVQDSSISFARGIGDGNTGTIAIKNLNSSCPMDGITVSGLSVDGSTDFANSQTVFINSGGPATPGGNVSILDSQIRNPYQEAIQASGAGWRGHVARSYLDRPRLQILTTLANPAPTGATTVTLAALGPNSASNVASMLSASQAVGVLLNSPNGRPQQVFKTTVASVSSSTVTLNSGLPYSNLPFEASAGNMFYADAILARQITRTGGPGSMTLILPTVTGFKVGDQCKLDAGTSGHDTVSPCMITSVNSTANEVGLNISTDSVIFGNLIVDTSRSSVTPTVELDGVSACDFQDDTVVGESGSVVLVGASMGGASTGALNFTSNCEFKSGQIRDIPPNVGSTNGFGINWNQVANGISRGVAYFPTAGSTASFAFSRNNNVPSFATTLAGSLNSTVNQMQLADPTQFPYLGNFYAKIDSEIMLVTPGNTALNETATITGTATQNDAITITLTPASGTAVSVQYTVQSGDTLANIAQKLVLAGNTPTLSAAQAGFTFTSNSNKLQIFPPSSLLPTGSWEYGYTQGSNTEAIGFTATSQNLPVLRAQLGTSAASHSNNATVSVAQSFTTETPSEDDDFSALQSAGTPFVYGAPGQGNWVKSAKGYDSANVFPAISGGGALTYTDQAPIWELTGSNTSITSLSLSTASLPFKTFCFDMYDTTATAFTVANGSGFSNSGGGTTTVHVRGTVPYCFDPNTQTAHQSALGTN